MNKRASPEGEGGVSRVPRVYLGPTSSEPLIY